MARRIFTIAGREGTVILTDSKPNENGKGTLDKYQTDGDDTQMCAIKVLNATLKRIPRFNIKPLSEPVVFLLPPFIEFLKYEDTRKYWLSNKCKKNGDPIPEEFLAQLEILDKQVKEIGRNVQLFGHKGLTSATFNSYVNATWRAMDSIIAPAIRADANEAF